MTGRSPIARGFALIAVYARDHPVPLATAITGSVVFAAGSVLGAVALGIATDIALVPLFNGGDPRVWAATALITGVMIMRSAGVIVRRYFAGKTAALARAKLQRGISDRIVLMPLDRVQARPPGQLLAHLDADTEAAIDALHPLPFSIGVTSMLIFAAISLALLDLPLMLATLGILPVLLFIGWGSANYLQKPTEVERAANAAVTAAAAEIIEGTQVIKTLGREEAELERFAEIVDHHRASRVRVASLQVTFDSAFSLLPQLAMILIVAVGTLRVDSGALDPGGLVQAVALFSVLAFPIQVIGFFLTELPLSVVGRERVDRVLCEPDDPARLLVGSDALQDGPLGARFVKVEVGPAERPRLAGIDLEVKPGETLALVGPTGGGKSTVIEVLSRLRSLDSGNVEIGGVPLTSISDRELRDRQAVSLQKSALFTGSVRECTDFGRGHSVDKVETALRQAGASDLQNTLADGFDTIVGERGVTLSGGQRQRLCLARALVGKPGMILLDDATSAVDPTLEEGIIETLASLPATVVMVTHRVAAMRAADRVALVADGKIRAIGAHYELLADPMYMNLVEAYRIAEDAS